MGDGYVILIIFGLIVLFGGIAWLSWWQAEKRRKELAKWAADHGWQFSRDSDHSFDNQFSGFSGLTRGSRRYAYNITSGKAGSRNMLAFDYHYETYSTDSKGRRRTNHHRFSAVIVDANLPLQSLKIREENFFDKMGQFLGFDDINFESAEFSNKFHVSGPNKKWAYDVLHPESMEYLLKAPKYTIELDHQHIFVYRSRTFDIKQFDAALELANGLLDRLPTSVVAEIKGEL